MVDIFEQLLEKLVEQRGPCKKLCDEGKIEELKLIVSDLNEPVVDENNDYIIYTP